MKRQNTENYDLHKSKHRVFLFIVKINKNFFKQFHQSKISTVLIKIIFHLRLRGNTKREFIGTCKYTEWRISA